MNFTTSRAAKAAVMAVLVNGGVKTGHWAAQKPATFGWFTRVERSAGGQSTALIT